MVEKWKKLLFLVNVARVIRNLTNSLLICQWRIKFLIKYDFCHSKKITKYVAKSKMIHYTYLAIGIQL